MPAAAATRLPSSTRSRTRLPRSVGAPTRANAPTCGRSVSAATVLDRHHRRRREPSLETGGGLADLRRLRGDDAEVDVVEAGRVGGGADLGGEVALAGDAQAPLVQGARLLVAPREHGDRQNA